MYAVKTYYYKQIVQIMSGSKKKISHYTVHMDKPLGEGATGKVYLCSLASNPEALFAVKIISKHQLEDNEYMKTALRREFKIHSQLKHPNIVNVVDMQETTNNLYIIQEYCAGATLKQVLSQRGRLDEKEMLFCAKQILKGYGELVKKGVIHRDLKPENILVSGDSLKIADFGFAKQVATLSQVLTSIVGSPIYMAPQILRGEKYNSKCDVWSFGIIIYEMAYGQFPWIQGNARHGSPHALLNKILTTPLHFPEEPQVAEPIREFIECCLMTDEKQRISWLQIFEHRLFGDEPEFAAIAQEYRLNAETAVHLLNNLAEQVEPYQLVGAFLQFKVKALDFKLFKIIIKKYLIPQTTENQLSIMYEMFDKDNNGVIDIEQFVNAFKVCEQAVLKLLNELVQKGMTYFQFKEEETFRAAAASIGEGDQRVIDMAYQIISQIKYSQQ